MKKEKGITLIALVITIIVLLILAGITMILVMGENGLIAKAMEAGKNYTEAESAENKDLNQLDNNIKEYISATRNPISAYNILYENKTGAAAGELNDSIDNYDILIAIYHAANRWY